MQKQLTGEFYIEGKDVTLPIVCKSPDGIFMYKHLKTASDGFRIYCVACGEVLREL